MQAMGFMVKHTSGLVCVAMEPERCEELQLPLMVPSQANEDKMLTAYTVSCVPPPPGPWIRPFRSRRCN
jgi:3,4-dihydroxy 2-butanone 4-phosphate synthase/GTP cyclohydrolase II